ncbi:hypothetical protein N7520_008634 [Penicillium odoratum]|uniref:uncharacterized protein n=1 Tax=Penicillium odoratum TaxID=1167516 RepID=UPI002546B4CE|nr:uncharacterized protein N7520_008634 [Penicillium odoratum]KAJ5751717.1 hypothetical protein N7520_008634 [Penicillium odoratum]
MNATQSTVGYQGRFIEALGDFEEDYEPLPILKQKLLAINEQIFKTYQPWVAFGSYDTKFWARCIRISISIFGGSKAAWEKTDQVKTILEQICVREKSCKIYMKRAESKPHARCGSIQQLCRKLFSTKKTPVLGMETVKLENKMHRYEELKFREELIRQYQAEHPVHFSLWCPVLGDWEDAYNITAVTLFPNMHGQAAMDAIFGKKSSPELFSPRNGILMSRFIEAHFRSGKLAIVPCNLTLLAENNHEYKIKVLDPTWALRDEFIAPHLKIPLGQLDDRKLVFRSSFRPAACYLYFSYCVQAIRYAWQHNPERLPRWVAGILEKKTGKPLWGSSARYISRSMLQVVVEELGQDYQSLLDGAKSRQFESACNQTLLEAVVNQVKSCRQNKEAMKLLPASYSESEYGDKSDDTSEFGEWYSESDYGDKREDRSDDRSDELSQDSSGEALKKWISGITV